MNQCTAKSKQTGKRCKRPVKEGATVCFVHGGAAGQVRRAAELRRAIVQADRDVTAFGGRLDITAPEALLELVQTKAAEIARGRS